MRRKRRRLKPSAIAIGAGLLLALAIVGPSTALDRDTMVPTLTYSPDCIDDVASGNGPVCMTDNAGTSAFFQSTVPASAIATIKTALGDYNNSDLSITYPASATYSGTAETDIIYQVSASGMPSGIIGWTWCDDAVNSLRCDQQYVRFRSASASTLDQELACHESGHAVGLVHGSDAYVQVADNDGANMRCMETPDTGTRPHPGANNADNVNDNY